MWSCRRARPRNSTTWRPRSRWPDGGRWSCRLICPTSTTSPRLATAAHETFGRLDVVINNVGGTIPNAFLDTTPEYMEEAFHFNVATAHALCRAAVPLMLKSGGGTVVNISSVMGRVSGRGYLAYGAAKAALAHYTRLAARDLAPRIRVNAIAVGSVATSALEFVVQDEETRAAMEAATPLHSHR